ncbi:hypothetical protein AGMMS50284_5520 [Clostridia bacterium]|nr:hypothetical protein AGMMS50284_5520 [Clostridia bacterium]
MSNSDFGLRIGLEGESAFKAALRDINQSFKVLGSEMQLVTSQFDRNDKSVGALTSRNTVLNREIEAQRDKITTLKSALDNASTSFGESDKRTQNWQIQLNKAQAELNGMERELSDNEKALDDMGKEEDDVAKSSDELGNELKDTGNEAEKSGGKFEKLGSVLKGIGAAMVVEAGANLIKGLWEGIKNVGAWLWDKIKGFFGGIVDGIKNFFGIHSPSTLFAGLGKNMGEGIGVGFEDTMGQVAKDMQNAIPTDFDINPNVRGSFAGAYGEGANTGTTVNNYYNTTLNSPKALSEKEAAREFKNLSRRLALGVT